MKRLVVLVLLAAAAALGVAAIAQGTDHPPKGKLTFDVKVFFEDTGYNAVDPDGEDDEGPAIGDILAGHGHVLMGGKKVGHAQFQNTFTNPEDAGASLFLAAVELPHGSLAFQGVDRGERPASTWAVTGGTGRYARAHGQAVSRFVEGTEEFAVFRIEVALK